MPETTNDSLDSGRGLNMVVTLPPFEKDQNSHLYTQSFGVAGDHLKAAIDTKDPGFLYGAERGISGITVHSISGADNNGTMGISFSHGTGENETPLDTDHRVLHVDGLTGEAAAYHIVHPTSSGTALHPGCNHVVVNTGSEVEDDTIRRATRWSDMNAKNVGYATQKVQHTNPDGSTVTRWIVSKADEDGNLGAIHRLISLNKDSSGFCDGAFSKANRIELSGDKYVVADHHFKNLSTQMTKALDVDSIPWSKGINVRAFTDKKPSGPVTIAMQLHRKRREQESHEPIKLPDDGPVAPPLQGVITETDVQKAFSQPIRGETIAPHKAGAATTVEAEAAGGSDTPSA